LASGANLLMAEIYSSISSHFDSPIQNKFYSERIFRLLLVQIQAGVSSKMTPEGAFLKHHHLNGLSKALCTQEDPMLSIFILCFQ